MTDRVAAQAFPPGEYLADELDDRGWSQADFADIIGRPVQFVSELINGKKELTPESASQIAAALGSEPTTWLALQTKYQLWRLAQDENHGPATTRVRQRAQIAAIIPLATLEKRGVIQPGADSASLLAELMGVFHMTNADAPPTFGMAAKRANKAEALTVTQRGWLWLATRAARGQLVDRFDEGALSDLTESLARETAEPADLAGLPLRFARVGVHLVFVEHLPGGKIDGAAFMLGENPVIALSGRGKRFDKLFFALLHEVGHVLCGHVTGGVLDDAADAETDSPLEREANEAAERILFGGPVHLDPPINGIEVQAAAERLGVPYSFVVGNLQHHGRLDWRTTLAKGLPNADEVLRSWVQVPQR